MNTEYTSKELHQARDYNNIPKLLNNNNDPDQTLNTQSFHFMCILELTFKHGTCRYLDTRKNIISLYLSLV